jgi:hypothetical protein
MGLAERLPAALENVDALLVRRQKASQIKELWRSTYQEAFQYAMPTRETFTWQTPGAQRNSRLYDSTLQEATYTAANTLIATVFPSWMRWSELAPGGAIPKSNVDLAIVAGLQKATETFFGFLESSNFSTVINESALDLQVGTASLQFDEGDNEQPFRFSAIPLSSIEIEEGPDGSIETTWLPRKIKARNLVRSYEGLDEFDLPHSIQQLIVHHPENDIELIQGCVYNPDNKHYYGIVIYPQDKSILWRWDFGPSSPMIVARASKVTGETYGRGRVLLALSDAKTLDKIVEFQLRHAAIQVAGAYTGVSDGVLNPYTAVIQPNVVIPVASNANDNPSLKLLDVGGNFMITDTMVEALRERIRRTLLGPEPSEGPVKSATEVLVQDRNRLWAMGGESGRIQVELLAKIVHRGVFILQRRGLIPKFKIDGRAVSIRFTSPFAKSQASEDLMALDRTLQTIGGLGPEAAPGALSIGLKISSIPEWVARKTGLDMDLVNSAEDRAKLQKETADAAVQAAPMLMGEEGGQPAAPAAGLAG